MPHARTLIRRQVVAQLKQHLPAELSQNLSATRETPVRKANGLVQQIGVYANTEEVDPKGYKDSPPEPARTLKLRIECLSNKGPDLDESLDELCRLVEAAVDEDVTLGGSCQDMRLMSTSYEFDDGDTLVGSAVLHYDCEYTLFVEEREGELVWFNRAGTQFSLSGAQAEADRTNDLLELRPGAEGPPPD
jgi:hypothetical protein